MIRRILSRIENPEFEAPELDWVNSEVRLLGKPFGVAKRIIEAKIKNGSMIVVRIEELPDKWVIETKDYTFFHRRIE